MSHFIAATDAATVPITRTLLIKIALFALLPKGTPPYFDSRMIVPQCFQWHILRVTFVLQDKY
jgi:hypothetical protein